VVCASKSGAVSPIFIVLPPHFSFERYFKHRGKSQ
jgi:hypothetical protein